MLSRIVIVLATTAAVAANLFAGVTLFMDPVSFSAEAAELQDTKRFHQKVLKTAEGAKPLEDVKHPEVKSQEALTEQLSQAIEGKNTEKVKALLAKGADANRPGKQGKLPLVTAAREGSMALVRLLLDSGADPKIRNRDGQTAMEAAFIEAMSRCHADVARYFLDMGVNVNAVSPKKSAVLQCAETCSPDFVKLLLENGADVNGKGNDGETALMAAAYWGRVEMTRFLLDNGADVNAKNNRGETALVGVASGLGLFQENPTNYNVPLRNQSDVVKLLLERGANVSVKDREGRTALMRFSVVGFPEAVKLLLEKGAEVNATLKDGSNALFWAIQGDRHFFPIRGLEDLVRRSQEQQERRQKRDRRKKNGDTDDRRLEVARLLIVHGIDVNAKLKGDSSTALTLAAALGDVELAKLILDRGAEMDARLTDGRTPLMCAVTSVLEFEIAKRLSPLYHMKAGKESSPAPETFSDSRRIDVAKLLLDRKSDVNAKRPDGTTALMWAMILCRTEMVKLLLERGADVATVLTDGSTVMQWDALHGHDDMVRLFAERGIKFTLAGVAMSGLRNEVRRLLDQGADANAKDAGGTTALMECARIGDLETARLLLDKGGDALAKDERGWTALHEAVWNGHLDVAVLLLDRKADPNPVDASGWPLLIQAAWKGRTEALSRLIARGADIRAKDALGKTALMRAVEMGHSDAALLLLSKGADVNAAEADGWTPMMAAVARQDIGIVKLLRKRGAKMTVAAAALLKDEREMQRLLKDAAKNYGQIADASMALLIATRNGSEDMVKNLVDKCPDINIKEPCCDTALLFAIKNKYSGIAEFLLKKGANANAADPEEETALHYAAYSGNMHLVRMLVERGADVNASTVDGTAPLARAVDNPNAEIVRFLLEKGARINAAVNYDFTQGAVRSGNKEVLDLLKAHGLKEPDQAQPPSPEDE